MPVSIIIGGQYGSEGKGKVAHFFSQKYKAAAVVRIGGPNSGHTVINNKNAPIIFKHLPTASIIPGTKCVLTAGSYINVEILLKEIEISEINPLDLLIDPFAVLISDEDIRNEQQGGLVTTIGSTACGLGSAIANRISRSNNVRFAKDEAKLKKYIRDTNSYLRGLLDNQERVIIEGTQGFGLSLLHSNLHPYCTSRDTTAAGFLSEAGLSPLDVDDIILVIRAFPIRVAGNSGPLKNETSWDDVSIESGSTTLFQEFTSVTKKLRRVAEFDEELVIRAIQYNNPSQIVLNHLDYIDHSSQCQELSDKIKDFLSEIEYKIDRKIDYVGLNRNSLLKLGQNKKTKQEQFQEM